MTHQPTRIALIERYLDALLQHPHAEPPPGLDAADAAFVRDLIRAQPVPSLDDALRMRLWRRVLANAIAYRLAQSIDEPVRAPSNTNGQHPQEAHTMIASLRTTRLSQARRPVSRRISWTMIATAAVCLLAVAGLLLTGNLTPPENGPVSGGVIDGNSTGGSAQGDHPSPTVTATATMIPSSTPTALPTFTATPTASLTPLIIPGDSPAIIIATPVPVGPTVQPPTEVPPDMIPAIEGARLVSQFVLAASSEVDGFVWTLDGSRLLSWNDNGSISIWDPATGALLAMQDQGPTPVTGAAWSPDGLRILTWHPDGMLWIWDLTNGILTRAGHGGPVNGAAWSPDGTRILSWADDGTARVWAASGAPLAVLQHDRWTVEGGRWDADGIHVTTWSGGTIRDWELEAQNELMLPVVTMTSSPIAPLTGSQMTGTQIIVEATQTVAASFVSVTPTLNIEQKTATQIVADATATADASFMTNTPIAPLTGSQMTGTQIIVEATATANALATPTLSVGQKSATQIFMDAIGTAEAPMAITITPIVGTP